MRDEPPHAKEQIIKANPDHTPGPTKKETRTPFFLVPPPLDRRLVRDRCDGLRPVVRRGDHPGAPGHGGLPLELDGGALGLCLPLQLGVNLDPAEEVVSRARRGDVLDPDVDALLEVSVLDLLVDDDANRALRDVVDDTGLAVVDLVRHTVWRSLVSYLFHQKRYRGSIQRRELGHNTVPHPRRFGFSKPDSPFPSHVSHRRIPWKRIVLPLLDGTVRLDVNNIADPGSGMVSISRRRENILFGPLAYLYCLR